MATFTQEQLRAIAFNIAGRSTEVQALSAYRLSWAGGGSGISAGLLQWDFGARSSYGTAIANMINAYNNWAGAGYELTAAEQTVLTNGLRLQGAQARDFLNNNPNLVGKINGFFSSRAGQAYVTLLDESTFQGVPSILGLGPYAQRLQSTTTISNMQTNDATSAMAVAMSVFNKSPSRAEDLLSYMEGGSRSVQEIRDYIRNNLGQAYYDHSTRAYNGAQLFNEIQDSGSSVGQALRDQLNFDSSLVGDFRARPYAQLLDAMFRSPGQGRALLNAIETGSTQGVLIPLSSRAPDETRFAGLTKDGDLFVLDKNGYGQRQVGGEWVPVINGDERGQGILIRKGSNGIWKIALADGTELPLAVDGETTNIGGNNIQFAQVTGSLLTEYAFDGTGQLRQIAYSGSGYSVATLTGPAAGSVATVAVSDGSTLDTLALVRTAFGPQSDAYSGTTATISTTITVSIDDGNGNKFLRVSQPIVSDDPTKSGSGRSIVDIYTRPGAEATRVYSQFYDDGSRAASFEGTINGTRLRVAFDYEDSGTARAVDAWYVDAAGNAIAPLNKSALLSALNDRSATPDTLVYIGKTQQQLAAGDANAGLDPTAPGYSQIDPATNAPYGVALSNELGGAIAANDATHPSGAQTLGNAIGQYGGSLLDALSLLKAIQSGEPLPILASGLRLANDISNLNGITDYNLSGAANVASGVLSLLSLDAALERGGTLGALTAGAQALSFGAQAYLDFANANQVMTGVDTATGIANLLNGTGNGVPGVLPALSLINAIANGDEAGVAVSALTVLNSAGAFAGTTLATAIPYLGWAYAVYSVIDSLFSDEPDIPDPWGSGRFTWNGNGISYQAAGETGGNEAVENVMNSTLATLNALIERERSQNPGSPLGIIPNRMPSVGYDMSGYRYTDIDPLTGAEQHPALRFDTSGRPYNAEAGSPESYPSLIEGMVRSALTRGAIAPLWEVQTAKLQTDAGDPKAGLTEEERAGRDGQLAAPSVGASQTFRPVVLDLDGDGIETVDKAHGIAFDVDDSGFLKATGWVKGDDAFLTLDRDYNGQFDSGRELFANGTVALGRRGLAGLNWVDADYDGRLSAADPVWNELKLWRDLDQDGAQDAGEVQGLDALGVTELDYAMGTFTQAGQRKQLASPDLEADKDGTRVSVVPEGSYAKQILLAVLACLFESLASATPPGSYPAVGYRDRQFTGIHCVPTDASTPPPELYLLKTTIAALAAGRQFDVEVAEFFSGRRYRAALTTEADYRVIVDVAGKRQGLDCVPRWGLGALDKEHPIDATGDYLVLERIGTTGAYGDFPLNNKCDAGVRGWVDCDVGTSGLSRRSANGTIKWARLLAIGVPFKGGHPLYELPRALNIIDEFNYGTLLNDGTAVLTYLDHMSIRIDMKTGLPVEPRPNIASVPLDDWAQLKRVLYERWNGYTPVVYSAADEWGGGGQYLSGGNPIYTPYAIQRTTDWDGNTTETIVYNPAPGQWNYEYHTTPITAEDSGAGRVNGADVDDPASSLTYEIVNQPQYGEHAANDWRWSEAA